MSDFTNKFKINGFDCYATWGVIFLKGTFQELLKFPKRKENFTQNFPDADGTLRQTDTLVYESQTYALRILVVGDSKMDFFNKLNTFRSYLMTAGYFNLDVYDLNIRFNLIYDNMSNYELKKRLNEGANYAVMTLNLINDNPGTNTPIPI